MAHESSNFYLAYLNDGQIEWEWGFQVFIDTDNNSSTGYLFDTIGADYLIEGASLQSYSGDGNTWNWTAGGTATVRVQNDFVELSFPRSALGNPSNLQLIFLGDNNAYENGCLSISSAGNSNADVRSYTPANIHTVMAVSAIDQYENKASFSNYGSLVDVAAPGVDILSLRSDGTDMYGDGIHIVGEKYYRANSK